MEIRKADINDIDILVANRIEFLNDMTVNKVILTEEFIKSTHDYMLEHITDESMITWMAIESGVIISTVMVCYYQILPVLTNFSGKTGYILNVFTHPDYRRKGIASQLINSMIQESRERKVGKLYLSASEMGMLVYKKLGFEVLTREMAYKIL